MTYLIDLLAPRGARVAPGTFALGFFCYWGLLEELKHSEGAQEYWGAFIH